MGQLTYDSTGIDATVLVADGYREMSKYVIEVRAYPSVYDGCKAVHRRVIYAAIKHLPRKKVKSALLVGETMKYHPHGDESIYGTTVGMASPCSPFPLFDKKGNFGGWNEGPAASRYTECMISDLAMKIYGQLLDYAEYVEGDTGYMEPKSLPALLPYSMLVGAGGIPTGMSPATIFPIHAVQLIDYFIETLKGNPNPPVPMPDLGECIINTDKKDIDNVVLQGSGKLWFKPIIHQENSGKFVVTFMTPDRSIDRVVNNSYIKELIDSDQLDYRDETTKDQRYVFECIGNKCDPGQVYETIDRVLSSSKSYTSIYAQDGDAVYCGLPYVAAKSLTYLKECTIRKFTAELVIHNKRLRILSAIEAFKKSGQVENITKLTKEDIIRIIMDLGYTEEEASEVPKKPISYLTRSHQDEIEALKNDISNDEYYLNNSHQYLIELYEDLRPDVEAIIADRPHSVLPTEVLSVDGKAKATLSNNEIVIDSTGTYDFDKIIYVIDDNGKVYPRNINARTSTRLEMVDIPTKVGISSDKFKYIGIIVSSNHFMAVSSDRVTYDRDFVKLWDDAKVTDAFGFNEEVEFSIDNSIMRATAQDYERTKVSYPFKITNGKITNWRVIK